MAKAKGGEVAVYDPKSFAVSTQIHDRFAGLMGRESAAKVGSTLWPFLKTRGAVFRDGERKIGAELECVILGTAPTRNYYEGEYDPGGETGPPTCSAIADVTNMDETQAVAAIDAMAPPADFEGKVASSCKLCPMNAWGSGKRGKGRACKLTRRLILVGRSDNYAKTSGVRLNVPIMSVAKLADYAKFLAEKGAPLIGVVTKISLSPLDQGGFQMDFEAVEPIRSLEALDALEQRAKEGHESLIAPPSTEPRAEKPEAKGAPKRRVVKRS